MSRVWSFFGKEVVTGGTTGTMIYVLDFCSVTLISIGFDYVVGTGDVTDVTAGVVLDFGWRNKLERIDSALFSVGANVWLWGRVIVIVYLIFPLFWESKHYFMVVYPVGQSTHTPLEM